MYEGFINLVGGLIAIALIFVAITCFVLLLGFWVVGFAKVTERERINEGWLSNSLVALAFASAIPAIYLKLPPEPVVVLRQLDIVECARYGLLILTLACSLKIRYSLGQFILPVRVLLLGAQLALAVATFMSPLAWTVIDARRAALGTRTVDPLEIDTPPLKPATADIVHISDLHISNLDKTLEGNIPGNAELDRLGKAIQAMNPRYLVITGDITDLGSATEWEKAISWLSSLSTSTKILLAPGNHDVNLFFGKEPEGESYTDSTELQVLGFAELSRIARVLVAQARLFPDPLTRSGKSIGSLSKNAPGSNSSQMFREQESKCWNECYRRNYPDEPNALAGIQMACSRDCKDWRTLRQYYYKSLSEEFPWVLLDSEKSLAFVTLASSSPEKGTTSAGRNAIGHIEEAQAEALRISLGTIPQSVRFFVFLLHHPLVIPKEEDASLKTAMGEWNSLKSLYHNLENSRLWANAFLRTNPGDSRRVLAIIHDEMASRGSHGLVMYGHRHLKTLSRWDNLTFIEAPHVSPDKTKEDRGFFAVSIGGSAPSIQWVQYDSYGP
jgi:3',5'-cyclic AMP phosphodiesterase CpdA